MLQVIKNLPTKKWLIIVFFAFGGGIICFSFTYLFPPIRFESEAIIGLHKNQDQNKLAYEIKVTLPKCTGGDNQVSGLKMAQRVLPVKAASNYISLSVTGESLVIVEKCLKDSIDFVLEHINRNVNIQIHSLENEIVAIDQLLNFFTKNSMTSKDNNFLYTSYPQELFLRKYQIIREIAILKNDSLGLIKTFSSQISMIYLLILRVIAGIFIGVLFGILIIVYLSKPFGIITIRRN